MKSLVQYSIYPFTMCISVLFFVLFMHSDKNMLWATTIPMVFAISAIMLFEKVLPYKQEWKPNANDLKNDALYLVLVQTLLPKIFVGLTALLMVGFLQKNELYIKGWWPHHWSLFSQEVLLVLLSDFMRYWLHRFCHTFPILWRLHAVHHSVDKMYWMNTSRFHPAEKALQFMLDVLPFMILGVGEEVIALHLVLYGVNGFFQHCNIDLKFGWLNYIVSSTTLHRWHHSKVINESNNNYGNNTIIWDIVFGSYFNPNKKLEELGLHNPEYPQDFAQQMKAPLIDDFDKIKQPSISLVQIVLNFLMKIKMFNISRKEYKRFLQGTNHISQHQEKVMLNIIQKNQNSEYGKEHQFNSIRNYEDFKKFIPINEYEDLRPYIEKQESNPRSKALIENDFYMFAKTSGTTSKPKFIPITKRALNNLQRSQRITTVRQYRIRPFGFKGKVVGIVSPAIDSYTNNGIPIGAASGHFYKSMPFAVKMKYVIPYELFEIKNFNLKYYCIVLLSLQHKDITYLGTANPSTIIKLIETLNEKRKELLYDLQHRTISMHANEEDYKTLNMLKQELKCKKKRLQELSHILNKQSEIRLEDVFPYLNTILVWTGGSCGITLNSIKKSLPKDTFIYDPGYLSSEMRGSITFNVGEQQNGLMTYLDNFYEFVERENYENKNMQFLLMHELEKNKEYYVFVTTPSGLFRYNMNDIIKVDGHKNKAPLIRFLQKGKGICSITGEKLYESQVIKCLQEIKSPYLYAQFLANQEKSVYECYIEFNDSNNVNKEEIEQLLDKLLREINLEYEEKRSGNRLLPLKVFLLKKGTFNALKQEAVAKGQNESQFKILLLQYKQNFSFNLNDYILC